MDTKLKNSRFSIRYKILAWALCIVSVSAIAVIIPVLATTNIQGAAPSYVQSNEVRYELSYYTDWVWAAYYQPTEAEIKATVDDKVNDLKLKRDEEIQRIQSIGVSEEELSNTVSGSTSIDGSVILQTNATLAKSTSASEGITSTAQIASSKPPAPNTDSDAVNEYKANRIEEVKQSYASQIAQVEQKVRDEYEKTRLGAMSYLANMTDILYVVYDVNNLSAPLGTNVQSKDPLSYLQQQQAALAGLFTTDGTGNKTIQYGELAPDQLLDVADDFTSYSSFGSNVPFETRGLAISVAMTSEKFLANEANYLSSYKLFEKMVILLIVSFVVLAASFVWLMYTAGRNPHNSNIKIGRADAIYLDIGFLLMIAVVILCILGVLSVSLTIFSTTQVPVFDLLNAMAFFGFIAAAVSAVILWGMSLARRNRNGSANKFTLAYKIFGNISESYKSSGLKARAVLGSIAFILIGFSIPLVIANGFYRNEGFGIFLGLILAIVYICILVRLQIKKATALGSISQGVEQIKDGNTDYVIPPTNDPDLDRIAMGINNIAEGLSSAVRKKVKSERMKTELITNISHDLKTPLTSILTYVDLLKKEKHLSSTAKKHLDVLDMKSHRLKVLTDDLFEAAKAASGDMVLNITRIELVQLMEQALGELSDRIEESNLDFEIDLPQNERIYVSADGKLLFRVLGNIIDNAIKYSLPASRIYLSMLQEDGDVCIVMKNVSKDKLNITEEELLERFVRGDSSRNTDGSGLGLAIARNFMQLMGGQFQIEIDGDLFKVKIRIAEVE